MALCNPKPLIKAFFSTKKKNKLHIWDDPNSCPYFVLRNELSWGSFPLAQTQNLTLHKLCWYCCGLQSHLNTMQSPGAPRVQSTLCKHLQHHSQHLLESSDIHRPVMQTSLNLNISQDISELPLVLFPQDNPISKEMKHNNQSVMAGRRIKLVC